MTANFQVRSKNPSITVLYSVCATLKQAYEAALDAGAFLAAAVWDGPWGGHICIWGQEFWMT